MGSDNSAGRAECLAEQLGVAHNSVAGRFVVVAHSSAAGSFVVAEYSAARPVAADSAAFEPGQEIAEPLSELSVGLIDSHCHPIPNCCLNTADVDSLRPKMVCKQMDCTTSSLDFALTKNNEN